MTLKNWILPLQLTDPLRQYFSLYRAVSQKQRRLICVCSVPLLPFYWMPGLNGLNFVFVYPFFFLLEDAINSIHYRFFSQAPVRYFWFLFCIAGSPETWNDCPSAALDLFIPGNQHIYNATSTMELDLMGLPLAEIAEDCLRFTGIAMEDVKFIWKGPGMFSILLLTAELFGVLTFWRW